MYNVRPTSKFQKDLKRAKRRGYDIDLPIPSPRRPRKPSICRPIW